MSVPTGHVVVCSACCKQPVSTGDVVVVVRCRRPRNCRRSRRGTSRTRCPCPRTTRRTTSTTAVRPCSASTSSNSDSTGNSHDRGRVEAGWPYSVLDSQVSPEADAAGPRAVSDSCEPVGARLAFVGSPRSNSRRPLETQCPLFTQTSLNHRCMGTLR